MLPSIAFAWFVTLFVAPDVRANDGVTLGGKAIDEAGDWSGDFIAMAERDVFIVSPASAAVVEIERRPR